MPVCALRGSRGQGVHGQRQCGQNVAVGFLPVGLKHDGRSGSSLIAAHVLKEFELARDLLSRVMDQVGRRIAVVGRAQGFECKLRLIGNNPQNRIR